MTVGLVVQKSPLVENPIRKDPPPLRDIPGLPDPLNLHPSLLVNIAPVSVLETVLPLPTIHIPVGVGEQTLSVPLPVLEVPYDD